MSPSQVVCTDGLRPAPLPKVRADLVVSRALTLFQRFDLASVPRSRRKEALRLAISEWSPFEDWAGAVVWSERGAAMVWIWEAGRVAALAQLEAGRAAKTMMPEPLLLGPGGAELDCVRVAEGWLARRYRDGELQAECFFATRPSAKDWAAAMIALDASTGAADSAWATLDSADAPPCYSAPTARWEAIDATRSSARFSAERAVLLAAAALVLGTLWLGAETLRDLRIRHLQKAELAAAERQAEPQKAARQQAFDAADRLRAWATLDPFPSALMLLNAVAGSLPPGAVVSEYRLDRGVVRATLSNPGARQTGDMVTRLQDSKLFSSVRVVPSGDPRTLRFELEAVSALGVESVKP